MGHEFRIHRAAARRLENLPRGLDDRILDELEEMVTNEFRELRDYDVRKLRGTAADIYRTRTGDYQVFFLQEDDLFAILHVDDREGAYGSLGSIDDRAEDY